MTYKMKLLVWVFTFTIIGGLFGNTQKIAVGGFISKGMTDDENTELKRKIDAKIKNTEGFSLIRFSTINNKINRDSQNLLDCITDACSHEISHIFGLNAVISGEVNFHENGVDIMVNLFYV